MNSAADPLVVSKEQAAIISKSFQFFVEKETLSVTQLLALSPSQWQAVQGNPNFGVTATSHWFSVELTPRNDFDGIIEIDRSPP